MWHSDSFFEGSEDEFELKIFHGGDKIYHNKFMKVPFDLNVQIGLKVTEKKFE